jgi:hypothetical protein
LAERYGFLLRSHKHEMYGVCPNCQGKRNGEARVNGDAKKKKN